MRDDIQLRVIEQRMLVQVRRADRHPGVIYDPNLGMNVDRPVSVGTDGVEGAGEQPTGIAVGLHQRSQLPTGIVRAFVRRGGE